ncbi:MAG TPA: Rrf2 family transcriptional regulator [Oligoflexus sp.]|uniref:RrF2 family transcriptional regulator n=1 Tax=Oligoflexus sp. TaxID=1971216 RepID=UPI002D5DB0A2|nr:Rrf2 family transcriptional regulator [Oligoflexus sp.]HYX38909.1 Rrf2 family transcriptional regulator [Oligoflexus sp.]
MEVSLYSDYAFRVLMYLALHRQGLVQIKTISDAYRVSENHLVKVVQHLVRQGYVASVRGRSGGIRLAKEPESIVLGEVFRRTEPSLKLLSCFEAEHTACPIVSMCSLQGVFQRALRSFLDELDKRTLASLVEQPLPMSSALSMPPHPVEKPTH